MKKILIFLFLVSNFLFCERQIYVAKRVKGEIKIDGNITEEEWNSPTITKFYRAGAIDKKIYSKTEVYILYDDNYLYIAGKMEDKDLVGEVKDKDGPVWNDDVFEVFIKPKFNLPHYYEINANLLGTLFDGFYPRKRANWLRFTKYYDSQAILKTKMKGTLNNWRDVDDGWEIEMAIPFSAFSQTTLPPKKGDRWFFAICRYDYSVYIPVGVELTSSAKLRRVDFHLYYDYDILIFK